ncbi:MAG: M28 family peptidase [Cyclobacteriaceae bacterium]|nr:M28 family peptidase [Cyclobacteriaceae bacterium]
MMYRICTILMFSGLLFFGCESSKKSVDHAAARNSKKAITVPSFNSDSAYLFIQKQVDFGPRVPNTDAHKVCGDFLVNKLKSYGAKVTEQNFREQAYNGTILHLKNIIAAYNPNARKRILLASHWDTRPYADKDFAGRYEAIDGANDGGSGVGILLEVARILSKNEKPNTGIDIILFDGEDYGEHEDVKNTPLKNGLVQIWWCLGSQYWADHPHVPKYSAYYGILLDMVGSKNARFYKEGGSMQFAPKVVKKVWKTARSLGYSNYFINTNSPGIMDDHIFVNRDAKIPMIDIVEFDPDSPSYYFGDYHHTRKDNMSIIDKQTLQAVGETVLYTIYNE